MRNEIESLCLLVADGDPQIGAKVRRALLKDRNSSDHRARLQGVLAYLLTTKGKTSAALRELKRGFTLLEKPKTWLELEQRRARIFVERGQVPYAIAIIEGRVLPKAAKEGPNAIAAGLFDRGWFLQLMQDPRAADDYKACLALTTDDSYRLHASTNLAALACERGDFDAVERFLKLSDHAYSRNILGMREVLRGRCLAANGDLIDAAKAQERAIHYWAHKGPADLAMATLELGKYLADAGRLDHAEDCLSGVATLAFELDGNQESAAAAVLTEVLREKSRIVRTAGQLGQYILRLSESLNPLDRHRHKRDRSRRRPRRRK